MAIKYPYTDFHEMNLDWILSTVKSLSSEFASVSEIVAELKNIVENYASDEAVAEAVDAKIDEMISNGTFQAIVDGYLSEYKTELLAVSQSYAREINGDVSLNLFTQNYYLNGAAYIGSGRIAIYFSSLSSDTGLLRIYDLNNKNIISETSIQGYHGNSIAYRDGKLYICAAYSVNDTNTLIPNIIVADINDLSNPSVYLPPIPGCYSLAYNADNDCFYAIAYRGTTPGEANRLYRLDADLSQVLDYVDLEDYAALRGMSSQGIQTIVDGIAYCAEYDNRQISAYNITDGSQVFIASLERVMNGYRPVGELEFITYDTDNGEFYVGATVQNVGEYGIEGGTVAKIGLLHGIHRKLFVPSNIRIGSRNDINPTVNYWADRRIAPITSDGVALMICDALTMAEICGKACNIIIYYGTLPNDYNGLSFTASGFSGMVTGDTGAAASHIPVKFIKLMGCTNAMLNNLKFNTFDSTSFVFGNYQLTGAIMINNSNVLLRNVSFSGAGRLIDTWGGTLNLTAMPTSPGSSYTIKGQQLIVYAPTSMGVTLEAGSGASYVINL